MSSLRSNAFCIVIKFLVCCSVFLSFFLVLFKNGPEYHTRETTQVFIPFMIFLLQSLISNNFLVLLKYYFLIFSFISVWGCPLPIFPSTCNFLSFLSNSLILSWFAVLFLLFFLFSHISLSVRHIFICQIPFLAVYSLALFPFLQIVWCQPSMCKRERRGDEDKLPYWPITSSLDYTTLCYLQGLTVLSLLLSSQGPLQAIAPLGTWWLVSMTDHI